MSLTRSSSSGYLPKKCSRTYAPFLDLKSWYSPSTHSSMRLSSSPVLSAASSGSQPEPQTTLMTFHPAPRKTPSSSWMIFPLPRTGPSSRCRLQFTTKIRLSSFSRPASEIAPSDSGSSISPSPRNAHTCRFAVSASPRALQVLEEPGLVDRHQRAETHRHRGELPEVGHQPRVRVGRQPAARHLLAEAEQLLLGEPALQERPGVDARGRRGPGRTAGRRRAVVSARARSG